MDAVADKAFPKSLQSRRKSTDRAVKAERVQEVVKYAAANPTMSKRELRDWIMSRWQVSRAESYGYIRSAARLAAEGAPEADELEPPVLYDQPYKAPESA